MNAYWERYKEKNKKGESYVSYLEVQLDKMSNSASLIQRLAVQVDSLESRANEADMRIIDLERTLDCKEKCIESQERQINALRLEIEETREIFKQQISGLKAIFGARSGDVGRMVEDSSHKKLKLSGECSSKIKRAESNLGASSHKRNRLVKEETTTLKENREPPKSYSHSSLGMYTKSKSKILEETIKNQLMKKKQPKKKGKNKL